MIPPKESERETNDGEYLGRRIVILGALASISLWLIVLFLGNPITPLATKSASFAYSLLVTSPAIIISILAIMRKGQGKKGT